MEERDWGEEGCGRCRLPGGTESKYTAAIGIRVHLRKRWKAVPARSDKERFLDGTEIFPHRAIMLSWVKTQLADTLDRKWRVPNHWSVGIHGKLAFGFYSRVKFFQLGEYMSFKLVGLLLCHVAQRDCMTRRAGLFTGRKRRQFQTSRE